jgi:hypothetical protein
MTVLTRREAIIRATAAAALLGFPAVPPPAEASPVATGPLDPPGFPPTPTASARETLERKLRERLALCPADPADEERWLRVSTDRRPLDARTADPREEIDRTLLDLLRNVEALLKAKGEPAPRFMTAPHFCLEDPGRGRLEIHAYCHVR